MRIWDLPPAILCRQHLLGEHRELHALWIILTQNKKGYAHHPETLRWIGKLPALAIRHTALIEEMKKRGYHHNSPLLHCNEVSGTTVQTVFLETPEKQKQLLRQKNCQCLV